MIDSNASVVKLVFSGHFSVKVSDCAPSANYAKAGAADALFTQWSSRIGQGEELPKTRKMSAQEDRRSPATL